MTSWANLMKAVLAGTVPWARRDALEGWPSGREERTH